MEQKKGKGRDGERKGVTVIETGSWTRPGRRKSKANDKSTVKVKGKREGTLWKKRHATLLTRARLGESSLSESHRPIPQLKRRGSNCQVGTWRKKEKGRRQGEERAVTASCLGGEIVIVLENLRTCSKLRKMMLKRETLNRGAGS